MVLAGSVIYKSVQYSSLLYIKTSIHYEFALGIPALIIIALFMARKNIMKVEELIKSIDRFR